jgi:hypothetical protein
MTDYIEFDGKKYKRFCNCNANWIKDTASSGAANYIVSNRFGSCPKCTLLYWINTNILAEEKIVDEEKVAGRRIRIRK